MAHLAYLTTNSGINQCGRVLRHLRMCTVHGFWYSQHAASKSCKGLKQNRKSKALVCRRHWGSVLKQANFYRVAGVHLFAASNLPLIGVLHSSASSKARNRRSSAVPAHSSPSGGGSSCVTEEGTARSQAHALQIHLEPAWGRIGEGSSATACHAYASSCYPSSSLARPPVLCVPSPKPPNQAYALPFRCSEGVPPPGRTILHRHAGVRHAVIKAPVSKGGKEDECVALARLHV